MQTLIPLKEMTWFRVGGHARYFFKPTNISELQDFLSNNTLPFWILGAGSNVLIRDGIVEGVTIKLFKEFSKIELQDDLIIAGAACLDRTLSMFALENCLSGFEFLVGIPGTIGGAVIMNAGAYGYEIKDIIKWVEILDEKGNLKRIEEFNMTYRNGNLPKHSIVVRAAFDAKKDSKESIELKMKEFLEKRENSQPLRVKTGGSTFKNPNLELKAWQCIDIAGCRGLQIRDAMVSKKHCNFLINLSDATAKDLEDLGNEVKERVFQALKIDLEWEILRVGNILSNL